MTGETGNRAPVRSFPAGAHPILLRPGLLEQIGTWLAESCATVFSTPCAIITNPRVNALYGDRVVTSLAANHFVPNVILIPEGERSKTPAQVYDRLINAQLDRQSPILALGGGVVGDLAGFVAATFRGVPLIHLPTTLLAMVDASIGGKVGVDHPRGKNLAGAFKLPQAVIADTVTLKTLPDAEFRAGLSEVVKHAIIGDAGLFGWLEKRAASIRSGASGALEIADIARAMRVKVDIVVRDLLKADVRTRLNLGHTFAHALEKVSGYEMRHGEAVSIGLVCASRLAMRIGVCDGTLLARLSALLKPFDLPIQVPRSMSSSEILNAMRTDEKPMGTRWRFVLPCELMNVRVAEGEIEYRSKKQAHV